MLWAQFGMATALASGTLSPFAVYAAEQSGSGSVPQASVPAESDGAVIEDIVVTAQKRSESINRVGLAVAALSGDVLQAQGIKNVADLATVTPGLSFSPTNTGTPVYTLRGIGFYESSLAAYPTVSVYVDEVPLPFPALTPEASLDLERVEVLKGPQGILFGQNSTGGAINYIAKKPTDRFEAGINVSYGRFSDIDGTAFISGPLASNLTARLALHAEHADDWQYSYTRKDSIGETKKAAARLLLDWQASDRLGFELNANGWIDRSDPQVPQVIGFSLASGAPVTPNGQKIVAYPLAPSNNRAADWSPNNRSRGNKRMGQISLRGNFELFDDITLTSISSYSRYRRRDISDQDGLSFSTIDFRSQDGDIKSFSQELRIANASDNAVRWHVGANYEKSTVNEFFQYYYPDSSVTDLLKGVAAGAGLDISRWNSNSFYSDQKLRNYAGFVNVEGDVSETVTVKAGARYTNSLRTTSSCNLDDDQHGEAELFSFLYGLPRTQADGTVIPAIADNGCVTSFQTPEGRVPTNFVGRLHEDNLSWRVGIDYKPTSSTLIYANVSKGYKAGSFPTAPATDVLQYRAVKQESILAYEIGVKMRPFGRLLDIDASAFFYNYRNKQLRTLFPDPVFGDLNNLSNIPRSEVKGFELSAVLRPVEGLRISGQGAYLDTRVNEFVGYDPSVTPKIIGNRDFAGARVPFTPKWSATGMIDYDFPITAAVNGFVGGTVSYKSGTSALVGGAPIDAIDSYTLLDLRAGIESADKRWRAQIWGKNVTNKYYWTNVIRIYDTVTRYTGRPATYGITVGYNF